MNKQEISILATSVGKQGQQRCGEESVCAGGLGVKILRMTIKSLMVALSVMA